MSLSLFPSLISFFVFFISLLVAITVHEFSHAAMADYLGDPTPRSNGRLTLNPLAHLDPLGTIMLILFRFGWGKPVPIDIFNLRSPRRDQALISLAGPASNLILAAFLALILRLPLIPSLLSSLIVPLIFLNLILAFFNLLPVFPLDGFKIVSGLLSKDKASEWEELKSYGPFLLLLFILPVFGKSLVGIILGPILNFFLQFLIPAGYTVI